MIVYLDASALAKLFLDEGGSTELRELWDSDVSAATSEVAVIELACALAAARRAGRLTARTPICAVVDGTVASDRLDLVPADSDVVRSAAALGVKNRLRALDALHLASALALREAGPTLVSWDRDQRRAAAAEGLLVYP